MFQKAELNNTASKWKLKSIVGEEKKQCPPKNTKTNNFNIITHIARFSDKYHIVGEYKKSHSWRPPCSVGIDFASPVFVPSFSGPSSYSARFTKRKYKMPT